MDAELHIAGIVVHCAPSHVERVSHAVARLADSIVHASSERGKLVVTLEAPTSEALAERIGEIHRIDGVLSAALVYQCADSLAAMNEEMPDAAA